MSSHKKPSKTRHCHQDIIQTSAKASKRVEDDLKSIMSSSTDTHWTESSSVGEFVAEGVIDQQVPVTASSLSALGIRSPLELCSTLHTTPTPTSTTTTIAYDSTTPIQSLPFKLPEDDECQDPGSGDRAKPLWDTMSQEDQNRWTALINEVDMVVKHQQEHQHQNYRFESVTSSPDLDSSRWSDTTYASVASASASNPDTHTYTTDSLESSCCSSPTTLSSCDDLNIDSTRYEYEDVFYQDEDEQEGVEHDVNGEGLDDFQTPHASNSNWNGVKDMAETRCHGSTPCFTTMPPPHMMYSPFIQQDQHNPRRASEPTPSSSREDHHGLGSGAYMTGPDFLRAFENQGHLTGLSITIPVQGQWTLAGPSSSASFPSHLPETPRHVDRHASLPGLVGAVTLEGVDRRRNASEAGLMLKREAGMRTLGSIDDDGEDDDCHHVKVNEYRWSTLRDIERRVTVDMERRRRRQAGNSTAGGRRPVQGTSRRASGMTDDAGAGLLLSRPIATARRVQPDFSLFAMSSSGSWGAAAAGRPGARRASGVAPDEPSPQRHHQYQPANPVTPRQQHAETSVTPGGVGVAAGDTATAPPEPARREREARLSFELPVRPDKAPMGPARQAMVEEAWEEVTGVRRWKATERPLVEGVARVPCGRMAVVESARRRGSSALAG